MNPTIHDVARQANVSISTVSRVVNQPLAVRKEKRDRVLQAIEQLGYEPNPFASGLRDRATKTIAAMIPDITNPFYAELFRGIEDIAREQKNNVIICNTDQDEARFLEYMSYFKKKKIDGLIFVSAAVTDAHHATFAELQVPVVLAATDGERFGLPYVKVNDYAAASDAASFLIKNGHRSIGVISGPADDPIAGIPRLAGFRDALAAYGLPHGANAVAYGTYDFDSGYEAMRKLYGTMPELTAVFAASDAMALGAMAFLQRRGMEVPRQISIIGFDNISLSRMVTPALTTVAQPVYEIGKQAAAMLFRRIGNPQDEAQSLVLGHEIVVRDTVWNRN
ncbi:LacI family DNA-binding transcriptional regulator [Paenibacillus flagellatus]|uniref:LacI family transcriptional regulator n=1 Tax=Paenibacillus flagellatus TaxID=2211139 RepID=A0A2V5KG85_9BACL|nr:LacI family DNA-binding transcriptional regulator [Paenibacillus flagellatus]PYI57283.1 LacI family transcriptional regulator [Paenibacillus flagellatus]